MVSLPVLADFGPATQEFHIGLGATTAPTALKGLVESHAALGRLPLPVILEPAIQAARNGVKLNKMQAFLHTVVEPIVTNHADGRALFCDESGQLLGEGAVMHNPDLADALELISQEGLRPLLEGDWGAALLRLCEDEGGHLTRDDLLGMQTRRDRALSVNYRGVEVLSNPPPSSGGALILFALALLSESEPHAFGGTEELQRLAQAQSLTNMARRKSGMSTAEDEVSVLAAAKHLLDPGFLKDFAAAMRSPQMTRGTTHISVLDAEGNLAALTISNGESAGRVLPGTGILLNNMLGEEDLNPRGFHNWTPGQRIGSMMAPSIARFSDGRAIALGSGGSNRIRTAIGQVLVNLIDHAMPLDAAIEAPRLHIERGVANAEESLPLEALSGADLELKEWPFGNLFFGGVHGVERCADGSSNAAGDPRRGGIGLTF